MMILIMRIMRFRKVKGYIKSFIEGSIGVGVWIYLFDCRGWVFTNYFIESRGWGWCVGFYVEFSF